MFRHPRRLPRTGFPALFGAVISWATVAVALEPPAPAENPLQTIVVTAKKLPVSDDVLAKQVVTALRQDARSAQRNINEFRAVQNTTHAPATTNVSN